MKISYQWLKRYIDTDLELDEILTVLTDIGLEVDGVERFESVRGGLEGVVVGEVLTCTDHPDSDHLHLTEVAVGREEPLKIVCGAPNVAAGQKVLVATVGAVLYPTDAQEGFKIKKSRIRGADSFGMICAEDELGIGTGHEGIMVLPQEAVPGTPAAAFLGLESDTVIEIGLTPNRADAMSHYGVARDLAAFLKAHGRRAELTLPGTEGFDDGGLPAAQIAVECPEGAPRYAGVVISGVRIGPSPDWMQNCLRAIGLNPKNNVVDITNFVLHELGQPLHSFDADRIAGGRVVVKTCAEGTKFVTLDGVERTLSERDLMICDAEKPMCIAGVMGGRDSGVSDATVNVFLESAYFNPVWIRKSAKRHGLSTDASFRYERGIDPNIAPYALKRAALLVTELAGGQISSPVTDIYPEPIQPFHFEISLDRVKRLIGKDIPDETIRKIIAALDVKIEQEEGETLHVAVPAYRVDVQREADLVEDILRIYGYNNVEIPQAVHSTLSYAPHPDREKVTNLIADLLTANGFNEIMSNSLTKAAYYDDLKAYKAENCVRIINPLSSDLSVMRQTLLFNALEAVELNTNRRNSDLKLYEFGNCYWYNPDKASEGGLAPYSEQNHLSILITGADHALSWNTKAQPTSFYTLKAMVEKLFNRIGIDLNSAVMESLQSDLYREAVTYKINGKQIVEMGIVSKKIRSKFDIKADVYYLEMNFDAFLKLTKNHKVTVEELSKFPEVRRDLALLVDTQVTFSQLREIAFSVEKKLLKNVTLFDVYEGDKLPAGKKSYALNFVLEDTTKTLTDQVIDRVMSNLIREFERRAGAQIR